MITLANIRRAIYCLNKRIDLLEQNGGSGGVSSEVIELQNKVTALESIISEGENPTAAIDKFNEIVAFLNSIQNTDTLSGLLLDIISLIPDALIQSDWNQTNNKSVDFIKNKPTAATPSTNGTGGSDGLLTAQDKEKLDGIESGAQVHIAPTNTEVINAIGYTPYNATNPNGYTSNTGTVTGVTVGTELYTPISGVVTIPAYPTTLPASDVYEWAKAANKPSYSYSEIEYAVNAATSVGGIVSLDGTVPLHVIILTGNVSALMLSANPPVGHSCHIILTSTTERTVAIAHDSTNRVCPTAEDVSLTIKANGYVEIDFLNVNGKIYVRGI